MIGIIAAIGKNNELGKDNKLIWHVPGDMKFFKRTTMGHKVIMGLNTYKSLPSSGLPGREMIVLTKEKKDDLENVKFVTDIHQLIDEYLDSEEEVFIIGGASIYKQFLPYAQYLLPAFRHRCFPVFYGKCPPSRQLIDQSAIRFPASG